MYRFMSMHGSDHLVLFCHDSLPHLAIDALSRMKLMQTKTGFDTTLRNKGKPTRK